MYVELSVLQTDIKMSLLKLSNTNVTQNEVSFK